MRTILPGKAQQREECVAFVMDWCNEKGLKPQIIPSKAGAGVVIRCLISFASFSKISIFEDSNDLVVESLAGDASILGDPAPSKTGIGFVVSLKSFFNKLNPLHFPMNCALETMHSEIKNRFADKQATRNKA